MARPHHHWSIDSQAHVPPDAGTDAHVRCVLDVIEPHDDALPDDGVPCVWIAALGADLAVSIIIHNEEGLYVAWLAAQGVPFDRVWLVWTLARDISTLPVGVAALTTLAALGAPVVFRIGLR